MTSFKTIAATAIIAVAGTVAAFGGLHLGQSSADAATTAQAAKARTTYAVSVTAKQRARLTHGQQRRASSATHRIRSAQHTRQATHRRGARAGYRSYRHSGGSYSHHSGSRSGYGCSNYRHSGGSGWNGSRSRGGWAGCR